MAKGSEIQDLANLLRGEGFSSEADKLVARLEKGEKLSRSLEKLLETISKKNSVELNKKLKTIRDMEKDVQELNERQKENLKITKDSVKELDRQNKAITNYIVSTTTATKSIERFSDMQSRSATNTRNATSFVESHASAIGVLDVALTALERVYDSWFQQQRDWTRGMGEFATRTGATALQLQAARDSADRMRGTLSRLGGSLTGIEESIRFVGDASLSMRMEVGAMSEELQMELLAAQRGLGASADEAALIARTLESGIEGGNESLGDFIINIREFAAEIGANASTMTRDWLDARNSLATFGEDGGNVFRRTATFANELGFETRRVLDMFRRFDTFGQASDNINQLNAMFGTTISSFELMSEEDPVTRIQMITNALQDQGYEWENMTRQQRMSIANSLGVSEDEAARLMNGEDMASISAEAEERRRREAESAEREARVREDILGILDRTSTAFRSISDYVQMIVDVVADDLSPIFNAVRDNSEGIMEASRDWVHSITGNSEFQEIVHDVADWLAEMPQHIRDFAPTWEDIRDTATEMRPMVEQIGDVIMSVIDFAVENPEAVGIALGVLAVGQLLGGFGGIAMLLSPGGVILAGIAALAAGAMESAAAVGDLRSRMEEINGTEGRLTDEEKNARDEGARSSLTALAMADSSVGLLERGVMTSSGLLEGVSRFAGFNELGNMLESNSITAGSTYDNMEENARNALLGGASTSNVINAILANARNGGEEAEIGIRRAFDISEGENLSSGVTRAVTELSSEVNPIANQEGAVSATESAPITLPTATASAPTSSGGSTEVIVREITMDGRPFGRAMIEVSRS